MLKTGLCRFFYICNLNNFTPPRYFYYALLLHFLTIFFSLVANHTKSIKLFPTQRELKGLEARH